MPSGKIGEIELGSGLAPLAVVAAVRYTTRWFDCAPRKT